MLFVLGNNCKAAMILKELGLREYSLPFDWTLTDLENTMKIIKLFFEADEEAEIKFIDNLFDFSKGEKYVQNYSGKERFKNTEYNLNFPHDDLIDIKEKYLRRFKRLKTNFLMIKK